jgi:hypothetical protein
MLKYLCSNISDEVDELCITIICEPYSYFVLLKGFFFSLIK